MRTSRTPTLPAPPAPAVAPPRPLEILTRLAGRIGRRSLPPPPAPDIEAPPAVNTVADAPAIFAPERLAHYARHLATTHPVTLYPRSGRTLRTRLDAAARFLAVAHEGLRTQITPERTGQRTNDFLPGAEWLLDNYYIIADQIAEIRVDLPQGYYSELPKLLSGSLRNYPRVYALARALVLAADSALDQGRITAFVSAYQSGLPPGMPLTLGELWSVPIMLRLSLVETLAHLISVGQQLRAQVIEADRWADELLNSAEAVSAQPVPVPPALARVAVARQASFTARLLTRLRDQDADLAPVLRWLDEQLAATGSSTDEALRRQHRQQTALVASIGNVIISMRRITAIDWPTFVENLSGTEAQLREDPAGIYPAMDFGTRDRYRHVVERLARGAQRLEGEVAAAAVALAADGATQDPADRRAHVGYYLIDAGRPQLEAAVGYAPTLREQMARLVQAYPTPVYLALVASSTAAATAAATGLARHYGGRGGALLGTAAVTAIPASNFAVSLVNHLITTVMQPHVLPKLEFKSGIPATARTFVVVPFLLGDTEQLREVLEQMEVRYLSNHDPHLHYALLTDFPDAAAEEGPGDAALLHEARMSIAALNARYGGDDRFYLFHRRRRWNPQEGVWMGWERKRGKLLEFNRLLRGTGGDDYTTRVGDLSILSQVRYVLTLDADTQLPAGSAGRLIGTMAHPLNRAELDADRRVIRGYGILQPRVGVTATSAAASPFARIFAGHTGVDPYTTAVSDVYQDLFHTGIYIGKGIYDVDAFQAAVDGRFPENTLLSHDLLEGSYARAGLASDILLYEDHPSRYSVHALRQDRWTRGDWQILAWLGPRVRDAQNAWVRNPLTLQARWQIFDNLRRSLGPPAALALFVAGATVLPGPSRVWTAVGTLVRATPLLTSLISGLPHKPPSTPWRRHLQYLGHEALLNTVHIALTTTLLPHRTQVRVTAIGRALTRMWITHRNLLEWQTAADAHRSTGNTLPDFFGRMWPSVAMNAGLALLNARTKQAVSIWPVLLAWIAAPWVAYRISQPTRASHRPLRADEQTMLRRAARKTWRYFEEFVGPADHWLAPDNYQEVPQGVLARRTSPTNLSLALLSTLAARDFGYLATGAFVERLEHQIAAMEGLERYRGHFYNWYETVTATPLSPRYVSTVDSGNLAGHLIVLKQGCLSHIDSPLFGPETLAGLGDTVRLLAEEAARTSGGTVPDGLRTALGAVEARLQTVPVTPPAWVAHLTDLAERATELANLVEETTARSPATTDLRYWTAALLEQMRGIQHDAESLLGWVATLGQAPAVLAPLAGPLLDDAAPAATPAGNLVWCARHLPIIRTMRQALREADLSRAAKDEAFAWVEQLQDQIMAAWSASEALTHHLRDLARRASALSTDMRFDFLFDHERKLFTIGYSVTEERRDGSYYDLLASESRLGSYLAVARGDVPPEHWFHLGRALTPVDNTQALVSWTGTMFEYLMPNLVMPIYTGTLLDQTCRAVVQAQQAYGQQHGVPWGISESAYNMVDGGSTYQYHAFGVPGLGLKRGLEDNLVIAPYATMLALSVDPPAAVANLSRLAAAGGEGRYGYYEAIDYTPGRAVPLGTRRERALEQTPPRPGHPHGAVVRTYMVHHQGMSLLALDNVLNGYTLPRHFLAEPLTQAADLLLQERIPRQAPQIRTTGGLDTTERSRRLPTEPDLPGDGVVTFYSAQTPQPQAHLLSNGAYTVMLTNAGGGYSQWRKDDSTPPLLVTRWRDDPTRDNWGTFTYLRDTRSGHVWSAGYAPCGGQAENYGGQWTPERAVFWRRDEDIETHTEIVISGEDDVEVRRLVLTNRSARPREIEVTSYAEVVLAPIEADMAHPAFQKLFVETEFVPAASALLATRRPRSDKEDPPWLMHVVSGDGTERGVLEYETDRARFLGRGSTPAQPLALYTSEPLSGSVGAVLDPIISLRRRVRLAPGQTARLTFATGLAPTRAAALALAEAYGQPAGGARAMRLAATSARILLGQRNLTPTAAMRAQRLASRVLFPDPALRPPPEVLARNTGGQPGLWAYGISGDLPILLVVISDPIQIPLVQEAVEAHDYWRVLGFAVDLVILNAYSEGYVQPVHDELRALLSRGAAAGQVDKPGGVFLRRADTMPEADQILLRTAARAVLLGRRGTLAQQLKRSQATGGVEPPTLPPPATNGSRRLPPATRPPLQARAAQAPRASSNPGFSNGLGEFSPDGREYVIHLGTDAWTPAPWSNVLANPEFGCLVSESTLGSTWWLNSRENRLTPWSNDPVSDPASDAIYLRDESSGECWTPTPLPMREDAHYTIRHGFGYTVYAHTSHGVAHELTVFVPPDAPVRIAWLKLQNRETAPRRITATSYVEWVMGVTRDPSARFVITNWDEEAGALLARNPYNNEFADRVAFAAATLPVSSYTADRAAFLGRNGSPAAPAGLAAPTLDGRTGAGLDPCAALQVTLDLPPGGTVEVAFFLGEAADPAAIQALLTRFRDDGTTHDPPQPTAVDMALAAARHGWDMVLQAVQVQTPDPALDLLLNGWLLYQAVACRIWARSAFYQGGGAYGFRDQLQDVLALVHAAPGMVREQIVRAAGRQFGEGDVQHWWHPPTGRGVRTRFSDDLIWLPYVTALYIEATGDASVLDEVLPFLAAPLLTPGQEDSYGYPSVSDETGTVYEHCVRALQRGATAGAHGLPLMGAGDWNDGMNRVGIEGRGESVWVGWFLAATLGRFAPLAEARGDTERAAWCQAEIARLQAALEASAWDGEWYRRAYFDDGTPLGSHENTECRIDSIAQSWAVLSGIADPARAAQAMESVTRHLVLPEDQLVLLFTPPFDKSPVDPGYIKGYVPGVRENGGQYTHAAIWVGVARAALRDGAGAHDLFSLLNPIHHASDPASRDRYSVEPYVIAADVYAQEAHLGRGGWTWYTGSASWMYRLGLESILGLRREGGDLRLDPTLPPSWPGFSAQVRHGEATYQITVDNAAGVGHGVAAVLLDDVPLPGGRIPLDPASGTHTVVVRLGPAG